MSDRENCQGEANDAKMKMEHHEISCPVIGPLNVYCQGTRSNNEVVILTVHDLGCDHSMYSGFVDSEEMSTIRDRTVWVHVEVPGQGHDAPDLPADYVYPTMQIVAEDLIHVLEQLKLREVVCFGEGAGANILARFAMIHIERVLGTVLIHCTGTTAGFMESVKDKVMNWKLDHTGMNPTAEAYLVIHRFGSSAASEITKSTNREQMKQAIETYQSTLRTHTNPKNLKKFVESFLNCVSLPRPTTSSGRTNIAESARKLSCPILLVTGQKSLFRNTTYSLYQSVLKQTVDKTKVEYIEIHGTANILEHKREKLAESFQYFIQGLGLVSSVPMPHVQLRAPRLRSMSMEEYDQPRMRQRSMSGGAPGAAMSTSPPRGSDGPPPPQQQPVAN